MQVLADENVHTLVIRHLRESGFTVEAIAESSPGASDQAILQRADIPDVVLITYDRDFGELIFKRDFPAPEALIYTRLGRAEPRYVSNRIAEILRCPPERGHCYVISRDGVRVRPFTAGSGIDG